VRLIGYCVESCLFLVYEFIENGNLSQHLHGTGKVLLFECITLHLQYCIALSLKYSAHIFLVGYEPLSWTSRVQIALDSWAHCSSVCSSRYQVCKYPDRQRFSSKGWNHSWSFPCFSHLMCNTSGTLQVADFGLTKLSEIGTTATSQSLPSLRVVGTFGYMPPE
jgi:chitin elicitor receptor kinase 1